MCFYSFIFKKFFIAVQVQLSSFSPLHCPQPEPSQPPTLKTTPFGFVHVSSIHAPLWHPHHCPLFSLSLLLSGYCQIVLYFSVSGGISLAYFVD